MEQGQRSESAIGCAMLRAAHLLWDDPPKIFEDPFAMRLSGCENEAALRTELDRRGAELARRTSAEVALAFRRYSTAMPVMRSRYIEDEVEQAIGRGLS